MRGRRVGEGGYDGEESYGEDHYFGGGKHFEGDWISVWIFFWCGSFDIGSFWVNHRRGHRVAGGFGHGGQDILTVSWS
jgi:hypothetical protein